MRLYDELPTDTTEATPAYLEMGPWEFVRVAVTIFRNRPETGAVYRLGTPSLTNKTGELRWFPTLAMDARGVWPLMPFEHPRVPFPGDYVVAYFSTEGEYLSTPIKVFVERNGPPNNDRGVRWCDGDRTMNLKAKR